jgi:hypothetical protein
MDKENVVYVYTHTHTYTHTMEYYSAIKKDESSWVPVAHAYNCSYSGGRVQEDSC